MVREKEICSVVIINKEKVDRVNKQLPSDADMKRTAQFFKAFGDSTRQRIIQALLIDELCVCDLAAITDVSISAISHQLKMLRELKIVKSQRDGKMVYYSVVGGHIQSLITQTITYLKD